jgi:hypothetical protein
VTEQAARHPVGQPTSYYLKREHPRLTEKHSTTRAGGKEASFSIILTRRAGENGTSFLSWRSHFQPYSKGHRPLEVVAL